MNDLHRHLAPITLDAWRAIDEQVAMTLKMMLAARKIVDFNGPLGFAAESVPTGRVATLASSPQEGVVAARRRVQPLIELRTPFTLSRVEIDAIPRGARNADLDAATDAARAIALAEDRAVFHGFREGEIEGICEAAAEDAIPITEDYEAYPGAVASALATLRTAGVGGPFAIALGPRCYTGLTQTTVGGFPVIAHVQRLVDGPVVWAPGLAGAAVLSRRGGDFELTVGRDLSVGYSAHSATSVELYVEETFTFQVLSPEAAVPLVYEELPARQQPGPAG